nr:hypothetical protein BaRGS_031104 [Batillaria attramentaria]
MDTCLVKLDGRGDFPNPSFSGNTTKCGNQEDGIINGKEFQKIYSMFASLPALKAAKIAMYKLEVHEVNTDGNILSVKDDALNNYTQEWNASDSLAGGPYDLRVQLPEDNPRLYVLLLEVHDNAGVHGNVGYARRLVLYDNSSSVKTDAAAALKVVSANGSLRSKQMIDILIDESPSTVGVVLEGLSDDDQAEMDFTSSDVVHVRWHGFLDHESGILLYRVVHYYYHYYYFCCYCYHYFYHYCY